MHETSNTTDRRRCFLVVLRTASTWSKDVTFFEFNCVQFCCAYFPVVNGKPPGHKFRAATKMRKFGKPI